MSAISTVGGSSYLPKETINVRPRTYLTSIWGDKFINSEYDSQVAEKYSKEIEGLKDQVRMMLVDHDHENTTDHKHTNTMMMNLIDSLERLGISYHFEDEIEHVLQQLFNPNANYADESYDLYTVAVHFRIFRQHGYRISSDIFRRFKDESTGNFRESLKNDVGGVISLYEAAHLRVHNETILEDALSFSTANLKCMAISPYLSRTLKKQVVDALAQPLHFGIPRIQARNFISIYENGESKSETLLKFAKLDYNLLQILHKQEMSEVTRWWKELDIISKLPYVRDRMAESYCWALGTYYEPQYSRARIMLAKTYIFTTILDDTYDASHISIENLEIFTEAIQRWELNEIDHLPETVKPVYKAFLELYAQYEQEVADEGRTCVVYYAKEAVKELARSYYAKAKGFTEGPLPCFAEYIADGIITCTNIMHTTLSLVGIESVGREEFEWLTTRPKIVIAGGIIGRLFNDLSSYEREIGEEGYFAAGIDCYMKDHAVTKEEAATKLIEMIENAWKDTNEECLMPSNHPQIVVRRIINFNRLVEVFYKNYVDGYTEPAKNVVKQHIIALLVDSVEIIL